MTTDADAYPITMAPDAREVAARLGLPPVIASAIHDRAHELQQQVQKMTPVDRQLHDASVAYENTRAGDAYPITMAPDAREVAARLGLPPVIASAIHDRAQLRVHR